MKKVYECENSKKAQLTKILEGDPYAEDSFARVGYKLKDGGALGQDKGKIYVYVSANEDFIKKVDEKLKPVAVHCKPDIEVAIIKKITEEEESAESGMGAIFG
ncbi:hypothetical protein HY991_03915 [Candidatus Micrarchaeota archaeon]|nr:hypothetical protein [Candidatus Micrarchaeota archaeon]